MKYDSSNGWSCGCATAPGWYPTMNIVCSCASSRLSTSIFTVMPLYASAAVAMLAETVGSSTDIPRFRRSMSMSLGLRRKRLRFLGSRTSSGTGGVSGAGPTKNVSGGSAGPRGRGDAISIQRAVPSARHAWRAPTGIAPHAPSFSRTAASSR